MNVNVRPHDRFSSRVALTPPAVKAYAESVFDDNPVHHDEAFAKATRFGRLIASGTQTGELLMALTAQHFSKHGSMVGLEFWLRFRKAIFADEVIDLEWLVIQVRPSAKLGGAIVDLRGRIRNAKGETALGAKGRVLVTEKL
jgi:3-hydroxybutyryl-CoA dehydratase